MESPLQPLHGPSEITERREGAGGDTTRAGISNLPSITYLTYVSNLRPFVTEIEIETEISGTLALQSLPSHCPPSWMLGPDNGLHLLALVRLNSHTNDAGAENDKKL